MSPIALRVIVVIVLWIPLLIILFLLNDKNASRIDACVSDYTFNTYLFG